MSRIENRLRSGLRWGLYFATGFSVVGGLSAIGDPDSLRDKYHLTLAGLIGLYFSCGIVGGLAFGLLRPIATTQLRAAFVGALVAMPVSLLAILVVLPDVRLFSGGFWFVWVAASFLAGPFVGAALWVSGVRRP